MKSATFPPLRVEPELRDAAQAVLREGETLSAFVEASVRAQIHARRSQDEFLSRGLASARDARASGRYVAAESVLSGLEAKLAKAKRR